MRVIIHLTIPFLKGVSVRQHPFLLVGESLAHPIQWPSNLPSCRVTLVNSAVLGLAYFR
jgi:hypothetical protein